MPPSPTAGDGLLPDGFLVGASTAAHQIEGNNVNANWWAYEHQAGSPVEEPSGDAADSYHRWPDDLDVAADVGLDAYRFSIEWARVEPAPGHFSPAEIQRYRRMVEGARDRGIEPVVTLHHFTEPRWFWEAGSWTAPGAVDRFARYVEALEPVLDGVRWVVTINEPNMAAIMARFVRPAGTTADPDPDADPGLGDGDSGAAAGSETEPGDRRRSRPHDGRLPRPDPATRDALIAAHRQVRDLLRRRHPEASVGWSVANQAVETRPGGEDAATRYIETREDAFLRASGEDDFVGVQAYTRTVFGPEGTVVRDDPENERTLTGWEFYPEALGRAVRHTREVAGDLPILVTENGIATADDDRRITYTRRALAGLREAMADGADVRGYLHWSLLDNYEWGSYRPRFGLVGWDPVTFERSPKPSARWLGDLARHRSLPEVRP